MGGLGSRPSERFGLVAHQIGAFANRWSRRSMITSLGDSGLPVFQAEHRDWQRPHSVQVAMSSRAFR